MNMKDNGSSKYEEIELVFEKYKEALAECIATRTAKIILKSLFERDLNRGNMQRVSHKPRDNPSPYQGRAPPSTPIEAR
jgi:hypothetical protein